MDVGVFKEMKTVRAQGGLYDLFEGFMLYRLDITLLETEVAEEEEMRIDLLFQRIYDLEPNVTDLYLKEIDIILFINHIDNPLNLKAGMIIKYPELSQTGNYRYVEDPNSRSRNKTPILAVPNVSTKRDSDRENFKKNGYSLPPVAKPVPSPSVRLDDGKVKIGGL